MFERSDGRCLKYWGESNKKEANLIFIAVTLICVVAWKFTQVDKSDLTNIDNDTMYYDVYRYKEVNTEEFVRFAKRYFKLEDNSEFEDWLEISK